MIEHNATVVAVTDREVLVAMIHQSSCASCRAKTLCSMSEQKEELTSLPLLPGQKLHVGEEVIVSLRSSLGLKAVFLMYVLPLFALLAVLCTLSYFNVSELVTGLAALIAPLSCYFIVWLFRERIGKEYVLCCRSKRNATP